MLIEQALELELRGPVSPDRKYILIQLLIFMTKQKSLRNIFEWIIFYC